MIPERFNLEAARRAAERTRRVYRAASFLYLAALGAFAGWLLVSWLASSLA